MFTKRENFHFLRFSSGGGTHIEVVQWLERLVLDRDTAALEPVWMCLGELVLGVRARDSDWKREYECAAVSANEKGNSQM